MSILSKKELDNLISALSYKEEQAVDYPNPILKEISQNEIDEIHRNGKITPYEWLKEMEEDYYDFCPISNESPRCTKFRTCHDCLVDYANAHDSFFPIFDIGLAAFSDKELETLISAITESEEDNKLVKKRK